MSQPESAALQGVADPPRPDPSAESEVARQTPGLQNGGKANLESRPHSTLDHHSLNSASSSVPEPSSPGGVDEASSSPSKTPREEDVEEENSKKHESTTPLVKNSRDVLKEGQPQAPAPAPSSIPPLQQTPQDSVPSGPPTSSYIPPSRSRPQAPPATSPPPVEDPLLSRGTMFRLKTPAQRRRNLANTNSLTNYEADLTSRDRAKQKEAITRFLDEKIEDEWAWNLPRPTSPPETLSDQLKKTGREAVRWKERDEWLSNTNDTDDDPTMPTAASPDTVSPVGSYKFESPDDVGDSIRRKELERKRRRERKLQDELEYNEGLRCFTARRDAWTGARRVPRDSELTRSSSRTLSSVIANGGTTTPAPATDDSQDPSSSASDRELETIVEIPVAPPLLPSSNGLRANITPAAYTTIYDKVIRQGTTPNCPINLQDVVSSMVQGWKRDGEWPPSSTAVEPPVAAKKKRGVSGIFEGFGKARIAREIAEDQAAQEGEGGLRKGLRMLGLRRASVVSTTGANGNGNTVNGYAAK